MGEVWDSFEEGSRRIGEMLGFESAGITPPSERTKRRRRAALESARPRRPATIDDAMMRQIETDRLRRRQGVLANIYGGANPSTPLVGTKTLLGS